MNNPEPPPDFGLAEPLLPSHPDALTCLEWLRDNIGHAKHIYERYYREDKDNHDMNPHKRKGRLQAYGKMLCTCDWLLSPRRPWNKALKAKKL